MKLDFSHPGKEYALKPTLLKTAQTLNLPYPREWDLQNLNLPPNWKEIFLKELAKVLKRWRSVRLYLDICVHCGACADKCHYFLATLDPNNMPVKRSDLLRNIYRKYFTKWGRLADKLSGKDVELNEDYIRTLYIYAYQCSMCRRCAVFCPYGVDNADITMASREVLSAIGLTPASLTVSIANCEVTGNHIGMTPRGLLNAVSLLEEEIEEETGVKVKVPINKKGAEVLYVPPSADFRPGGPHWETFKGAIKFFHHIGLDYTLSTKASEGGNFGTWLNYEHMKKINRKVYEEAVRLGVKWILGGECGHMYRVVQAFMATMNGDLAEKLEVPQSPFTGTVFENAAATKVVHIMEFVADLFKHKRLDVDKSKNDKYVVTFSDSCNPARVMGLIEEPRYVIRQVCNNYVEMDPNVNREKTLCCGAGGGLLTGETLRLRLKAIKPKIDAIKATGANYLALICAIDKSAYDEYFIHYDMDVKVGGVIELVGNAINFVADNLRR